MGADVSPEEKAKQVESIIDLLELRSFANMIVGEEAAGEGASLDNIDATLRWFFYLVALQVWVRFTCQACARDFVFLLVHPSVLPRSMTLKERMHINMCRPA
jgi:hypothetical protein